MLLLVFLGIVAILGWTGLFVLNSWLVTHAFTILDIIIWIGIGIISLPIITAIVIINWLLLSTFIAWTWQKIQNRIENKKRYKQNNINITSVTNIITNKNFWEEVENND